ncbi:putative transferase CAF17 -like protein, mitochondrial [Halotydeus destructor]|nr:putative transferase CAF17 -like protein, mitochondrial [Halotydeus destructor]
MADILVYRTDKDSMLVECDSQVVNTVHKNLIIHKLKKKVSVKMRQDMNVYAIFPDTESQPSSPTVGSSSHDHVLTADPRLPSMCLHRLVSREANFDDLRKDMNTLGMISDRSELDYRLFRYRIGLGEGHLDHPSGSAFPLESNGDYLHGISFFKGCYVGQELTARTYHTGVTRKRIMPVESATSGVISVEPDSRLTSADGKKRLGKMRSANGHLGLALVYHEEIAKHDYTLYHQDTALRTKRPSWWPKTERDKMAEKIDSS